MVFQLTPLLRLDRYDTYGIVQPKKTHFRPAKCAEVTRRCTAILKGSKDKNTEVFCGEPHCGPFTHGWQTLIDVSTSIGRQRAKYIIDHSGRHWTAKQAGTAVTFTFAEGQQCFEEHQIPLERPALFTFKQQHSQTTARPRIIDGTEWLDRFGENQINLKEQIERG